MAYKTILAHLKDERRVAGIIATALALGERGNAHVTGITALPQIYVLPAGSPGLGDTVVIEEHRNAYAAQAERIRAKFTAAALGRPLIAQWLLEDAEAGGLTGDVAARILHHAHNADLVIAGQDDPKWDGAHQHDISEALVLESGRPVLLIPRDFEGPCTGRRIMVAWNGTREAARAVFDAMALLRAAEHVCIVAIDHGGGGGGKPSEADTTLVDTLANHGVRCGGIERRRSQVDDGSAILSSLDEHGCDMLVMGCYGHSRFREFAVGGATWHVLHHMKVPVLMSH